MLKRRMRLSLKDRCIQTHIPQTKNPHPGIVFGGGITSQQQEFEQPSVTNRSQTAGIQIVLQKVELWVPPNMGGLQLMVMWLLSGISICSWKARTCAKTLAQRSGQTQFGWIIYILSRSCSSNFPSKNPLLYDILRS